MAKSLDETTVPNQSAKWFDFSTKFDFKKNEWHTVRFFGPVWQDQKHQIKTRNGKWYPEYCHGWDVDNDKYFADKADRCPVCALLEKDPDLSKNADGKPLVITTSPRFMMNLMDTELEENKPQNPKPDWTPIRLADLATTAFTRLKELKVPNKNYPVDHPTMGALVQIKYNKETSPDKQYNITMDTKNLALTDEQLAYTVMQRFPDAPPKIVKGKNGLPALWEYIRCVNSRENMIKSLRAHGYYGDSKTFAMPGKRFGEDEELSREEEVARVDAEAPVEVMSIEPEVMEDEAPTPKPKKKSSEPYEDCPTSFGDFAQAVECFTQCGVSEKCREATEAASGKKETDTPAPKKDQVNAQNDDDDTV